MKAPSQQAEDAPVAELVLGRQGHIVEDPLRRQDPDEDDDARERREGGQEPVASFNRRGRLTLSRLLYPSLPPRHSALSSLVRIREPIGKVDE